MSPKWRGNLCRVGRKALTQSINQSRRTCLNEDVIVGLSNFDVDWRVAAVVGSQDAQNGVVDSSEGQQHHQQPDAHRHLHPCIDTFCVTNPLYEPIFAHSSNMGTVSAIVPESQKLTKKLSCRWQTRVTRCITTNGKILKQSRDHKHALSLVICHPVARIDIAYPYTKFDDFRFSRSSDMIGACTKILMG